MSFVAIAIVGSAVVGAGTSIYEGDKAQSAAEQAQQQQEQLAQSLTYTPIDVDQLQKQATAASIANATASLNLQKQLQPNVVAANNALQKQVADNLKLGGQLTPDEQSQVAQAARVAGGSSGAVGGIGPYTAALTGQSANALMLQREGAAAGVVAANPAPAVGLSPSDLASATIANNNALNQFNLSKAGVQSNLINSNAQLQAGAAGQTAANVGSALNGAASLASLYKPAATPGVTTGTVSPTTPFVTPTLAPINTSIVSGYGGAT